jgi:hypothetical protein
MRTNKEQFQFFHLSDKKDITQEFSVSVVNSDSRNES